MVQDWKVNEPGYSKMPYACGQIQPEVQDSTQRVVITEKIVVVLVTWNMNFRCLLLEVKVVFSAPGKKHSLRN